MAHVALIVAQMLDPIRVILMLICVWIVVKVYARYGPLRKISAYAVLVSLVAIIMMMVIDALHPGRDTDATISATLATGYVANWLIVGIAHICMQIIRVRRRQHP